MAFLQKSYQDFNKVKKLFLATMNYEGSNDEVELKMVPICNQNNNYIM